MYVSATHSPSSNVSLYDNGPTAAVQEDLASVYLHAELKRIDDLINDVEMQGPLSEELTCIVIDTNIVLSHLEVIEHFVTDIEKLSLPVIIIVPGIVINELDGQKTRGRLGWMARRASTWLLLRVKERKSVKGQALHETCKASKNWKSKEEIGSTRQNDALILDCCKYFLEVRKHRTFLCSADKNLCFEAESESIPTILPNRSRHWSSQDIAEVLFGQNVDISQFAAHKPSYRLSSIIDVNKAEQPHVNVPPQEDDSMDVDDEYLASPAEILLPNHPLDLLHMQVIEHFTRLLVELVGRILDASNKRNRDERGTDSSKYAQVLPILTGLSQKNYQEWSASECLDYLRTKKPLPRTSPRVDVFLSLPYSRGARRGQDWSRKDWEIALDALAETGDLWQEGYIRESIAFLKPIINDVFSRPMRPTGT